MKIYRGYKFRMYPNKEQEKLLNKTIGICVINLSIKSIHF